ncbi:MAG TPA: hypothetical protein VGQ46_01730 [Thermoanaerobaculia bacterium]|jgi:hypothetical protein|nr:hypothetical protein [Thermoanaerobaculia bacterium]
MRAFFIGAAFCVAVTAAAQEPRLTPPPDYSRDALLHFVGRSDIKMSPLPDHLEPGRIRWHAGWFEFRGLGMQWRIVYLPIVAPLSGTGLRSVATVPNPLDMTPTRIASGTDVFAERRASVNREMKRVLKLQRQATKQ